MLSTFVLQAALPTLLLPSPSMDAIHKPHHIPTKSGHTDNPPFATHNKLGWERICMPTVVSQLRSNAYRSKVGNPGEGEVFNIHTNLWEEQDAAVKERFLGFQPRDTVAPGVTEAACHPAWTGIGRHNYALAGCTLAR